jgi:hypothetical protein
MENCTTVFNQVVELAFVRRGIRVPEYPYTKNITVYGNVVEITAGKRESVTYAIDYGKEDDIKVSFMPPIVRVWRHTPGLVEIVAAREGKCCMVLSSRHDSDVFKHLELVIKPKQEIPVEEEEIEVEEQEEEEDNG